MILPSALWKTQMDNEKLTIDDVLVRRLVTSQFSQWKDLSIRPVDIGGWDNRMFHLGNQMLVRMPSAVRYADKVEKEQKWLPRLAPLLPLSIPEPLAMGKPGEGYPWQWSIYRWIEGETAASAHISDLSDFAISLAEFLRVLQSIDSTGGPPAGPHNFYRGGELTVYDTETRKAIAALRGKIDIDTAIEVWETALSTSWQGSSVWVHGDISAGNLLLQEEKLSAVIDFGGLAVGDPSCDLAIAWTLFKGESREAFCTTLSLDEGTWARGRAWTLWKALIVAAAFSNPNNLEAKECWHIIDEVLADHKSLIT